MVALEEHPFPLFKPAHLTVCGFQPKIAPKMAPKSASTASSGWLYDLILNIFSPSVDVFFREVQVRGAWRVPQNGAVILVAAPHANQFVDGLILMRIMKALNRHVSWLMAEKSFDKPIIGPLARLVGAVPVSRAMDNMKSAQGTIHLLDPDGDPKLLGGVGTEFDGPGFEVGGSMYLPAISGESQRIDIAEICGPDRIVLKNAPTTEDAFLQLSQPGGTTFKVAPHVDQTGVYDAVFERLRQEGCIGIFPEGGSHDRTDLLPLKGKPPCFKRSQLMTFFSRYRDHGSRKSSSRDSSLSRSNRNELLPCPQVSLQSSR